MVDVQAQHERRRDALRLLGRIERRARLHRGVTPQRFQLLGQAAVRVRGRELVGVPAAVVPRRPADRPAGPVVRAASRADLVRFGKFDRDGTIRARAFLLGGRPHTVKLQTQRPGARHGVATEVAARLRAAALAPDLAPRMVDHEVDDERGVAWLAEECLDGTHPSTQAQVTATLESLLDAVVPLYAAGGVTRRPLSEVLSPATAARFAAAVEAEPGLRPLLDRVHQLLSADRDVEVAFGHGDLVSSNVLVRPSGDVLLLDWEYAGDLPVAFDVGKPLAQAEDKVHAVDAITAALGRHVGRSATSYRLAEQLALSQVQTLSWYGTRRDKARRAGRMKAFREDVARRIETLEVLLGS